jgi:death-on-curing protein
MTKYLAIDEVMAIHEKMIELFGGREGINDFTMLHSAVERCKASFGRKDLYLTIFDKAAALIQSLILNHPFDDGNKRTAITSCARFLYLNGYFLRLSKKKSIKFTLDIDAHRVNFEQTTFWLKKHVKKMTG